MLHVSVIVTVLNERETMPALLASLAEQTRLPDEIVIVDGGSTDGTLAYLRNEARLSRLSLTVLSLAGANISSGRNHAIRAAKGDVIAATDAGVRLGAHWLEHLVAPFEGEPSPDVVAGVFRSAPESLFERALGAITLPRLDELQSDAFLPSSRSVAFTKDAWSSVGGYPEWLDYCEDLVFDLALRRQGAVFALAADAIAHFRPRPNLAAFAKQYYRYARGDGKADLWRLRHAIRYGTYLFAGPALLILSAVHSAWWLIGLVLGAVGMFSRPVRRLLPELKRSRWKDAVVMLALLPVIVITGDLAKMAGYPVGLVWRWRHRGRVDGRCRA
ncbi:MAG: glycosyltransferase [Anaerolineae bacterium]|nr:glycosyltransferase [Anaerolineae bacterium]